jgi:ubiquinone/menaquinone biosynthesis C-methylase UbiE
MKIRESGMPEEERWNQFFNPVSILKTMGITNNIKNVAEFGCGYATFTIPTAKIIRENIYALDIEPEMIELTKTKAIKNKLTNIIAIQKDFMADGSGLKDKSIDYVMLFNILHLKKKKKLLREANRILKPKGKLGIIHWNYDKTTPRGPPMNIRPKPEQCIEWAKQAGFNNPEKHNLKPYHYGIVMTKRSS